MGEKGGMILLGVYIGVGFEHRTDDLKSRLFLFLISLKFNSLVRVGKSVVKTPERRMKPSAFKVVTTRGGIDLCMIKRASRGVDLYEYSRGFRIISINSEKRA